MNLPEQLHSPTNSYTIQSQVGRGAFGVTFRAQREADQRSVILKLLRWDRLKDWKAVELFEREARVLKQLSHPNVPEYLDYFSLGSASKPEGYVLVQAFVPGRSLRNAMLEKEKFSNDEMYAWFKQILEVLHYLHSLNPPVIHRDISPKNIMLTPAGQAYLIDFGTVQDVVRRTESIASTSAGTYGYSPAEQFMGRSLPASDLYGLAMTYIALSTGREPDELPHQGLKIDVSKTFASMRVDARLLLLLEQMTIVDPEDRLKDASIALERLSPLVQNAFDLNLSVPEDPNPKEEIQNENHKDSKSKNVLSQIDDDAESEIPLSVLPDTLSLQIPVTSTQLRNAAKRLQNIPENSLWSDAPEDQLDEAVDTLAVSDSGTHFIVTTYTACFLVAIENLSITTLIQECITERQAAFSADGKRLCISDYYNKRLYLFDLADDSSIQPRVIPLKELGSFAPDHQVAISPDYHLIAIGYENRVLFIDWNSGDILSPLSLPFEQDLSSSFFFSPDAQMLCGSNSSLTVFVKQDGSISKFNTPSVALSLDGRMLAMVPINQPEGEMAIELGEFESLVPDLKWKPTRVVINQGHSGDLKQIRFSPDRRWLAVEYETSESIGDDDLWGCEIAVVDVINLTVFTRFRDPYRPNRLLGPLTSIGFSSDSSRLWLLEGFYGTPLCFSITDRSFIGMIAFVFNSPHKKNEAVFNVFYQGKKTSGESYQVTPVGYTFDGFYGPLMESRVSKNDSIFSRPDLVRRVLSKETLESLLEPTDQLRLLDWRDRFSIYRKMRACKRLPRKSDLGPLVQATTGLTHLVPRIIEDAEKSQKQKNRFSPKSMLQLHSNAIISAANDLKKRSKEELEIIFEQTLEKVEALEREMANAHARRLAKKQALIETQRRLEKERQEQERLKSQALKAQEEARLREEARKQLEASRLLEAKQLFIEATIEEERQRRRWFCFWRKDYSKAFALYQQAAHLGLVEAAKAALRLKKKMKINIQN